jgi:hypothetical protein
MAITLLHYLGEVIAHKWLATGYVDKFQPRQAFQVGSGNLLTDTCRVLPDAAHFAPHRTTIG